MAFHSQRLLALVSVIVGGALVVGLFAGYLLFDSQLAFAQAADSFMDVFTAGILMWTITIAAQPKDKEHPFGHSRAEPIGGLVTAVVAGILAIEVARNAIDALLTHSELKLPIWLLLVFMAKGVFKLVVVFTASKLHKRTGSPAMKALKVDARNDVLVALLAIAGFELTRRGAHSVDAWLALPVAAWIGWAGVGLARDNIKLLMGEAPPEERREKLFSIAASCPGVDRVRNVKAHYLGTELQVTMDVVVNPELSLRAAHDIGEAVKARIEQEDDIGQCLVHVDIE
jgi:cation diffusion facilitator family transporter